MGGGNLAVMSKIYIKKTAAHLVHPAPVPSGPHLCILLHSTCLRPVVVVFFRVVASGDGGATGHAAASFRHPGTVVLCAGRVFDAARWWW